MAARLVPGGEHPTSLSPDRGADREARRLVAGQDFGTRYQIIKTLGIGGMGVVYEAWDRKLGVRVALKVVRPEVAADPKKAAELDRRFKRELLLAREVTHHNVVRIHDLGEIDGLQYITMTYIDGEDLGRLLTREGRLSVERALPMIRGMVAGLVAAHEAGVVHRDLKPANIMVGNSDEAFIMDFGVARSAGREGDETEQAERLGTDLGRPDLGKTVKGAIVGTPNYMAPEQYRGQVADVRSDLYALGLVMYDMLSGKSRAADGVVTDVQKRSEALPPPPHSIDLEIPEALGAIVSRCLEPDPEDRLQTSRELQDELDRLDEHGQRLPIARRLTGRLVAASLGLFFVLLAGTWWLAGGRLPEESPEPVAVLIADLANETGDSAFDGTLEPMLRRVLEGAGFITAYDRSSAGALGVPLPDRLDEDAARELAVQQGLGVVLSGSIEPRGSAYGISVNAIQTMTGEVILKAHGRARSRDQVLDVATKLMVRVRKALGDDPAESAQQFAMTSLSATSLEVVGLYAAAMEALSALKFEEARTHAARAVELDPEFGVGYLILATSSANLREFADVEKYLDEALRHLDSMTERERYATRGFFYWASGDNEQCVGEYRNMLELYPASVSGRNQLALCLIALHQTRRAVEQMQEIVKTLPNQPLFRTNLALFANYAGDFKTAEEAARVLGWQNAYAVRALAFAQVGQGQLSRARETYQRLARMDGLGPSFAASGLGDLAAFEGRFSDAVEILRQGAAQNLAAGDFGLAAAKLAAIAYAELSRSHTGAAIEAAEEALGHSSSVKVRFLAARTFVEVGDFDRARPLIDGLASELYAEPRAYGKLLEGGIALRLGEAGNAMSLLREANDLFDTWIGLFDLGRASLAAGAYVQADSAFDVCLNIRRGEALSLFVDQEPTYAYLPLAYYYQGRARESIGTAGYRDAYQQYLNIRGESTEDPLLSEVRDKVESRG